jgi:hypothetical protein
MGQTFLAKVDQVDDRSRTRTMKLTLKHTLATLVALSLSEPVAAGPAEDIAAASAVAYGNGDYATALRLI